MLAHSVVTRKAGDPERFMLFLHGILGTRANWRGIARKFVEGRPGWGALLVDLREHGDSLDLRPPHTLAQVATDLHELETSLGLPIGGALGHSFGGKVVLQWLTARQGQPTEAWTIDSSPSTSDSRDDTAVADVLRALQSMPRDWASRDAFIATIIAQGLSERIGQWLAMNLQRGDDGSRFFGPRLEVIGALIDDYAQTDLWPVVEALPPGCTLDAVIGADSAVCSAGDRARMKRIAAADARFRTHEIDGAGHWVHVDAPDALLSLLVAGPGATP